MAGDTHLSNWLSCKRGTTKAEFRHLQSNEGCSWEICIDYIGYGKRSAARSGHVEIGRNPIAMTVLTRCAFLLVGGERISQCDGALVPGAWMGLSPPSFRMTE